MKNSSYILSCGSYLPKNVTTNEDLSKIVDTNDEWIFTRTGIKSRHIASDDETTSYMATEAARKAIAQYPEIKDEIDAIIVATTSPDQVFPSTAAKVQANLDLKSGCAFDIQAVCSGFLYALSLADSMVKSGQARVVLVIGAETMSKMVDWNDRTTCVLFGDGAGAVLVAKNESEDNSGIIASKLCADGKLGDILYTKAGDRTSNCIVMEGKEVFRHGVEKMSSSMASLLAENNLTVNDVNWVIPHQANIRMISAIANKLDIPMEKIVVTLETQANTSAATIPLALDYHYRLGKLKRGDLIAMAAAGGGFTWGAMLLRW